MWLEQVRDSYGTATAGDVEWEPCAVVCYITGFPVFALLSGEAEKRHSEMGSARELYVRGWWEEGVRESGARGVLAGGCARTATPSRSCGVQTNWFARNRGQVGCPIPGVPLGCPG